MTDYPNNLEMAEEPDELLDEIMETYTKAPGWLPVETYDLIQVGYPYPTHGEMRRMHYGGTNADNHLLPPRGMWCKAEDVRKLLEEIGYLQTPDPEQS